MDPLAVPRPCYVHEDDGLLSLADVEACFSGNFTITNDDDDDSKQYRNSSICHSAQVCSPRGGFRSRPYGRSYDARWFEEERRPHFLDACFLCKKLLGNNRDIFMYRGDTAFCSEECRQEQIDVDESKEKKINLSSSSSSSSVRALRKTQQESFRPGAVAAA